MSSPFDRKDQWIQQGPDGHHFYVRQKNPPQLPSFKAIFLEAFHDLRHGHPSYWREWKRQNKEKRRQAKEAKAAAAAAAAVTLNQPHPAFIASTANLSRNSSFNHLPATPSFIHSFGTPSNINLPHHNPSNSMPLNMSNMQSSQPDNGNGNNQPGATRGILKSDLQRFPSTNNGFPPWQGMPLQPPVPTPTMPQGFHQPFIGYPPQVGYGASNSFQPPVNQHIAQPQPPHLQASQPQMPLGPIQPPGGWPLQPLPPGARAVSPPRYPTAHDLKYKCAICDRFRSAGFHYRHPLTPGQLPPKTVCRKCRIASTDSEDDSSDSRDKYGEQSRGRRRRSRSARRIESVGAYRGRALSPCGRPLSREYCPTNDDWYSSENHRTRSASRSTSIESIHRAPLRARSRSVISRVRVEQPVEEEIVLVHRPHPVRRVIYIDEDHARRGDGYSLTDQSDHAYGRHLGYARAPTPAPRSMRSQRSDPGLRSPCRSEQNDYLDDVMSARSSSRRPQQSWSHGSNQEYSSKMEKEWYAKEPVRDSGRSKERRSAYHDFGRGFEGQARPASGYGWSGDEDTTVFTAHDETGSSSSIQRMKRAASRNRMAVPTRLPDQRPTNVDSASNSDDYDYYDKDGMRIRVREI